jgi:hypothetical protein
MGLCPKLLKQEGFSSPHNAASLRVLEGLLGFEKGRQEDMIGCDSDYGTSRAEIHGQRGDTKPWAGPLVSVGQAFNHARPSTPYHTGFGLQIRE